MPGTRIAIDGLFRCLCPSIDISVSSSLKVRSRQSISRSSIPRATRVFSRPSSFASRSVHSGPKTSFPDHDPGRSKVEDARALANLSTSVQYRSKNYERLDDLPLTELNDTLRHLWTEDGGHKKIAELVDYLITKRREMPSLVHYDALIRANADASYGSADAVRRLLQEVDNERIVPDSGIYHSALMALAVHPDYVLRNEIMREMKDRWFILNGDGWHHLIVGLLRDRQYELALQKLDKMVHEGVPVQSWLYDVFIYLFCEAEELDEAMRIMRHRVAQGDTNISDNLWYYLLDTCSSNYHYDGTQYVWRRRVETSYINPPDGMCTNVLNTAARHRDPNLATDVVRVLSNRTSKLDIHHYEALVEAYSSSADLKTALQILSIMKKARFEPTKATTRPIYSLLCEIKQSPSDAFDIVKALNESGQIVPIAAVNVILEASVTRGNLDEAVRLYKYLHVVCPSGPNIGTFNTILQGCSKNPGNKSIAMFLASEMASLGIRPDVLTYDRLVLVCLGSDSYEDAFRYLEEMGQMIRGSDLRPGTITALIKRCVEAGDERAWTLLDNLESKGQSGNRMRSWAEEMWKGKGATMKSIEGEKGTVEGDL